jgi:hypothetical protein
MKSIIRSRGFFAFLLVALYLPASLFSWSSRPINAGVNRQEVTRSSNACPSRRKVVASLVQSFLFVSWADKRSAIAQNLPTPTGADTSQVGTIEALLPLVALRQSLVNVQSQLTNQQATLSLDSIPTKELEFKRLFDSYSDPVSYKQKFLEQNAFLVYYTKGFDGPGRPNIESDVNERQAIQFGARNEAWIAWDDFLVELKFKDDKDNDIEKYITNTIRAVDSYLQLAPPEDLVKAKSKFAISW